MHFSISQVISNIFKTPYLRKACISTFLILIAFPLVFYFALGPTMSDVIVQNIETNANATARHFSELINPKNQEMTEALFKDPAKAAVIDGFRNDQKFEKIQIFSKTGKVLYSSSPTDIGLINTKPYFHDLVAKGYNYSKIVQKEQKTAEGRVVKTDIVEAYAPVMHLEKFLGAFEIYYDITEEKASLANMIRFYGLLWLGLTLSLLVAFSFVFYYTSKEMLQHQLAQTEKREGEKRLLHEKATRLEALGSLSGGIAHDFNNILAIITGFTELALAKVEPSSEVVEDLQEVLAAGERARILIQQILAFSKDADQRHEPILLKNFLEDVIKSLKLACPANVAIHTRIDSDAYVFAETSKLRQLIMNLCTNGLQAIEGKKGDLNIALTNVEIDSENAEHYHALRPGPFVKLSITDNGKGIKEEDIPRIFDPFFTTKKRGLGNGMGLTAAHGIVQGLHGVIHVYSENGKGSTFNVFLPKYSTGQPSEAKDTPPAETPGPAKETILFVDDEAALAKIGQRLLEKIGYRVKTTTSSTEALELFQSTPDKFDLVISDISMPIMTGDELAKEILDIRPDVPIILCSGFAGTTKNDLHQKVDVKAIIDKPIMKDDLARTIRQVLNASLQEKKGAKP